MNIEELIEILDTARVKLIADSCAGCAYTEVKEWEVPCAKCKRNCKDFWESDKE